MEVALALACSHAGLIISRRDRAAAGPSGEFFGAMDTLRAEIAAAQVDAIVVLATDHMRAWTLGTGIPQFAVGVGPVAHGLGDGGVAPVDLPVHQDIARAVLTGCVEADVDLAFVEDVKIDHSFVVPLTLLDPTGTIPIVPLTQNTNVAPRPTFRRSHAFGTQLRDVLDTVPGRVAFVATGGLSHWVGDQRRQDFMRRPAGTRFPDLATHRVTLEETGPVNEEFDRSFMAAVAAGESARFVAGWTDDALEAAAGNGAHEIRNWVTACGFMRDRPASTVAYAPVAEWLTGVGVMRFDTDGTA